MKLAEALLLRGDLQKKLASLRERIAQNAVVQQGDIPHEDPAELLLQAHGVLDELEKLVFKINQANLRNKISDGRTLTEAIARRETLVAQHSLINTAIQGSKKEPDRYSMSEIKWVATMEVAKLQKQLEDLAKKIRELNVAIQEANWKADIE
jgi:flagellar biosynthesis/type III secretory pathway chaperone